MKTPITYFGGKQRLSKHLLKFFPPHELYVEPFVGGAALYFAKPPSKAEILNDINGFVVNFYKMLKWNFGELKHLIDGTLYSRHDHKEAMQVYANPDDFDKLMQAWAFWVLTNQGYSGRIGLWGVDYGCKMANSLLNKKMNFTPELSSRLEHTSFEAVDALELIKRIDAKAKDVFYFVDPPYFNAHRGHYPDYSEEDYTKLLVLLSQVSGKFMLSSYPSKVLYRFIQEQHWHYLKFRQKVGVSHKANKEKIEVIVCNYPLTSHCRIDTSLASKNCICYDEKNLKSLDFIKSEVHVCKQSKRPIRSNAKVDMKEIEHKSDKQVFELIYLSFCNGLKNGKAKAAREKVKELGLSIEASGAAFSSGQLHHRKSQSVKEVLERVGILKRSDVPTNAGQVPYSTFGNYALVFPLRDETGSVVNFFSLGIRSDKRAFLNEEGIYPCFPPVETTRLLVATSVLIAARYLSNEELKEGEAIISLYEGELKAQHEILIEGLKLLNEIIYLEDEND